MSWIKVLLGRCKKRIQWEKAHKDWRPGSRNFAPVWDLLVNEFTEVSTIHAVFSYKIAEEIEKPLKTQASAEYNEIGKVWIDQQEAFDDFFRLWTLSPYVDWADNAKARKRFWWEWKKGTILHECWLGCKIKCWLMRCRRKRLARRAIYSNVPRRMGRRKGQEMMQRLIGAHKDLDIWRYFSIETSETSSNCTKTFISSIKPQKKHG